MVWKNAYWTLRIIDQKIYLLSKYHIIAMFLQLVAAHFISAKDVKNDLQWLVEQDHTGKEYPLHGYTEDATWVRFNLLPNTYKHRVLW